VWNAIPETFNCLKKVAVAILSLFPSTYLCESLFFTMNFIKSDVRSRLTDGTSAGCIALKTAKCTPNIKHLSSMVQQ
jgi:hypothetical protein